MAPKSAPKSAAKTAAKSNLNNITLKNGKNSFSDLDAKDLDEINLEFGNLKAENTKLLDDLKAAKKSGNKATVDDLETKIDMNNKKKSFLNRENAAILAALVAGGVVVSSMNTDKLTEECIDACVKDNCKTDSVNVCYKDAQMYERTMYSKNDYCEMKCNDKHKDALEKTAEKGSGLISAISSSIFTGCSLQSMMIFMIPLMVLCLIKL